MDKRTTRFTPFLHITIPTSAMSAPNQLPNLNPFDSMTKWLANAVTRIALSRRTVMIDRALAEDLAAIFEVRVEEIPCDVSGLVAFINGYISKHAEEETIEFLKFRLQVVAGRLHDMLEKMVSQFDQ